MTSAFKYYYNNEDFDGYWLLGQQVLVIDIMKKFTGTFKKQ